MKVVIIASLSQMDDIYKVVNICQKLGIEVHYPRKRPDKEFSKIVEEYFGIETLSKNPLAKQYIDKLTIEQKKNIEVYVYDKIS